MDQNEILEEVSREGRDAMRREDFWLKAATWTFGLWALMLPITAGLIVSRISEVVDSIRIQAIEHDEFHDSFITHREQTESRLARFEERQNNVLRRLDDLERVVKEKQ